MSLLKLPDWLKNHLFEKRNYKDLSAQEIDSLRERLSRFSAEEPEVSVVIPAWNEENNIFRTLSSLAQSNTTYKVEIIVINNNSTDSTQKILDNLGVRSYFQIEQGIAYARQMGLENAKGKYHLCADSDSFYPPKWIDTMVKSMDTYPEVVCVYGRYSFIPPDGEGRFGLFLYEKLTGLLIRLRKKRKEYINVLGFNMGFVTELGRLTGGFMKGQVRKFGNEKNSTEYTQSSEDGQMALHLMSKGQIRLIKDPKARVFTSSRRLLMDGGLTNAFFSRLKLHGEKILKSVFRTS